MRKEQNVLNFALKAATFAGLAAILSSCLVVVDDSRTGPPTVSNVRVQSTYCSTTTKATDVTLLDFKFDYTGDVDIDRVESAWVVIPDDKAVSGENDASVTNPLAPPATFRVRSSIGSGTLFNFVSGRTYKGTLRLTMGDGAGDYTLPADLETIKAQAVILNGPGRLWVRGITRAGAETPWSRATNLTQPINRVDGPCDGNI
jgi:hypothetical protein